MNVEPVFVHTFLFDLHPASRRVPGLHNNKVQSDSRALKIDFCCPRLVPGGGQTAWGKFSRDVVTSRSQCEHGGSQGDCRGGVAHRATGVSKLLPVGRYD